MAKKGKAEKARRLSKRLSEEARLRELRKLLESD